MDVTSQFDLGAIAGMPREVFTELLRALPDDDRAALRSWAERARDIRADETTSRNEKEKRIMALDTNATLLRTLRGLLDALAERAPAGQRKLVKNGLTVAAVATATLNFEFAGLALIAIRAALPTFVLSEAGEKFCANLLAHTDTDAASVG